MRGNTFGRAFQLTSFGESHGGAIGGVVDGCPAGLKVDIEAIQRELDRRRPGGTSLGTARNEADRIEILSGVMEGITLGTPIAFIIRNTDARSQDYDHLKNTFRPGHADLTWEQKFGLRDHRGGGRSSARETAVRVAAGAIARQLIANVGIRVQAYVSQVGAVLEEHAHADLDLASVFQNDVRSAHAATAERMQEAIETARAEGDTVGGAIRCLISGAPAGLGEPVFDKLHADLGKAMLGINAAKAFSIGSGFEAPGMRGSAHNDAYTADNGRIRPATDRSGGVQGGISNGEDIVFDVAFKPVSTLMRDQQSVDREGKPVVLEGKGRHDPCVVPRAVPVVEAMACLVMADHLLRQRSARI